MKPDLVKLESEVKKHDYAVIESVINKYLAMDRATLQLAIANQQLPMLDLCVASVIAQAAQKGDIVRFEFILSQLARRSLRG